MTLLNSIVICRVDYSRSTNIGDGIRSAIYLQGCNIRCPACHNKELWDIDKGKRVAIDWLVKDIREKCFNKKITILGGEPLYQAKSSEILLSKLEDFNIALYTGYDKKDVPTNILNKLTYLKYGKFKE